jgi:VIT1/CCC1 family predicted Fe2+/Mn2+ transporter
MKHSIKVGLNFGLASGVITTLGLMVGLNAGTASKMVVLGGILTIAIADSMSDAMGIHMSEESENVHTATEVWISTITTFLAKLIFALTFAIPVLLFHLQTAIIVSIVWGLLLIIISTYFAAKKQKNGVMGPIIEHLTVAILVIIATDLVGSAIADMFQS